MKLSNASCRTVCLGMSCRELSFTTAPVGGTGGEHYGARSRRTGISWPWQVLDSNKSGGFLARGDTAQSAAD